MLSGVDAVPSPREPLSCRNSKAAEAGFALESVSGSGFGRGASERRAFMRSMRAAVRETSEVRRRCRRCVSWTLRRRSVIESVVGASEEDVKFRPCEED